MNPAAFAIALLAAATLILSAPFISQSRHYLREAFPDHFILILGIVVGGSIAAAILAAVVRISGRRALRYGAIAAALVLGAAYSAASSSPDPQVAAVERFHFVQYGLITFLFYRAWRPLGDAGVLLLPAVAAMLTGTLEEWFQWFIPGRVGTMEDVFLNWVAIACGLLFSVGFAPPSHGVLHLARRSLHHFGTAVAVFAVVFGMFFDSVHLGHEVHDPRIGSFASIYTADELRWHAADREVRWRTEPPVDRTRLGREDQYRTEGIQHVQERNRAWERGDFAAAWRENLILETYYAPVLERGHQWPHEQRADASSRASAPAAFTSRAYPYEVYTWPALTFWSSILAAAAAIVLLTHRARRT
jgi:VanZ family protein